MTAPTLHGPITEAAALQTLKPLGRAYQRIILREEIGPRAFGHVTEVRACGEPTWTPAEVTR